MKCVDGDTSYRNFTVELEDQLFKVVLIIKCTCTVFY